LEPLLPHLSNTEFCARNHEGDPLLFTHEDGVDAKALRLDGVTPPSPFREVWAETLLKRVPGEKKEVFTDFPIRLYFATSTSAPPTSKSTP